MKSDGQIPAQIYVRKRTAFGVGSDSKWVFISRTPRYFFHVLHHDSDKALDQEGIELEDHRSAQAEAIQSLCDLAADAIRRGGRIEIVDEGGKVLRVVKASEIIR
jgi:hypothetical protein